MKRLFKSTLIIALVIAAAFGVMQVIKPADAATGNPGPTLPGYQIIAIGPISATTTTTTGIWEIKAPWPFKVLGFQGHSNAMSNTVTFNLLNSAGTSLLSSALTPTTTAGVVTEATLTTSSSTLNIADESVLRIDTSTLSNGTTTNTTLQLMIKRL